MLGFIATFVAATILSVVVLNGQVTAHFDGGGGGHGLGPMGFLRNVTDDQRQQFFDISTNFNLTKSQQLVQLQQWASNISSEILTEVNNFTQTMQQMQQQFLQRIGANLTSDALTIFNEVKAVVENQSISLFEECTHVQAILSNASSTIRHQLKIPPIPCDQLNRLGGNSGPGGPGFGHPPHGGFSGNGSHGLPGNGSWSPFHGRNTSMGNHSGTMDSRSAESPEVQPNA